MPKVKIVASYSWTEEVTDEDLRDICEAEDMERHPEEGYDEDQLDEAFNMWKSDKETSIEENTSNISDDAILDLTIEVIK